MSLSIHEQVFINSLGEHLSSRGALQPLSTVGISTRFANEEAEAQGISPCSPSW